MPHCAGNQGRYRTAAAVVQLWTVPKPDGPRIPEGNLGDVLGVRRGSSRPNRSRHLCVGSLLARGPGMHDSDLGFRGAVCMLVFSRCACPTCAGVCVGIMQCSSANVLMPIWVFLPLTRCLPRVPACLRLQFRFQAAVDICRAFVWNVWCKREPDDMETAAGLPPSMPFSAILPCLSFFLSGIRHWHAQATHSHAHSYSHAHSHPFPISGTGTLKLHSTKVAQPAGQPT